MNYEKVTIWLRKDIVEDIEKILEYKHLRDFLFEKEENHYNLETFVVGSVCYYLRKIKGIEDLAGVTELGKPYKLKNRILEILEHKQMSQAELAKITNIQPSNITNIVKNKNQPSIDYFLRLWIALDCPALDWMFYREEVNKSE